MHQRWSLQLILCALVLVFFSGCGPVIIAGAAAGGYYVGTDDRTFGRIVDDSSITTKIKSKYIADGDIKSLDIKVKTRSGVVTLFGPVQNQGVASKAIQIARDTDGVRGVNSRLTISGNS